MSRSSGPRPVPRALGLLLLMVSGLGSPLSQIAIARLGRGGALIVEGVTAALLARDTYLVASGVPARLEPLPAALLYAELAVAALGSALGLRALTDLGIAGTTSRTPDAVEVLRRAALGTLFGLHTWRFAIYLGLDRRLAGRRSTSGAPGSARARAAARAE